MPRPVLKSRFQVHVRHRYWVCYATSRLVGCVARSEAYRRTAMCRSMVRLPVPKCVVKVDGGRGFIIVHRVKVPNFPRRKGIRTRSYVEKRMIITASHCLPNVPAPNRAPEYIDRTFPELVATLDNSHKDISVECLFVDPIADI